jgi:hypothetical protein
MPGLTNPVSLTRRDGLFSDLAGSGTMYTLWNGSSDPNGGFPFNVSQFRSLNTDLSLGNTYVNLSSAINVTNGDAIYAGKGYVILQSSNNFYKVEIPSGTVTNLGYYSIAKYGSESWGTWGVAEENAGVHSVLYRDNNSQNINRLNLSNGGVSTAAPFSSLSDLCCFTVSPWNNRWYFHYEGGAQFGGSSETAGYADATITNSAGVCLSNRVPVTVTISDLTVAGSVSGGTTICPGNTTGDLLLTGNNGVVNNWEYSIDNGSSWNQVTSTDTIYNTVLNIGGTYWFRAVVQNGSCGSDFSNYTTVNVPGINAISMQSGNSGTCNIVSPNNWVHILDLGSNLIASVFDTSAGNDLMNTTAYLTLDNSVQSQPMTHEPYMQRHVQITPVSDGAAAVKIYFTQAEFNELQLVNPAILSVNDLAVTKFSDTGYWSNAVYFPNPVVTANDPFPGIYSLEIQVGGFSDFYIHGKQLNGPLPVKLLEFDARCAGTTASISWITATESNNDHFTLERSSDLTKWTTIATIQGAGNSNQVKHYAFTDEEAGDGINYYRLTQVDFDGTENVYAAIPVHCEDASLMDVTFYPNPFNEDLTVTFAGRASKEAEVLIYDMLGKCVVKRIMTESEIKDGLTTFNLSSLASAVYTIEFRSGTYQKIARIVKN